MKKIFFVLFLLFSQDIYAQRISATIPSKQQTSVQYLLENLENSINSQDYSSYISCFDKSHKNNEEIINIFLQDYVHFEIKNHIVTKQTDESVCFYVRYELKVNDHSYDVTSLVQAKFLEDNLLIVSEKIKKLSSDSVANSVAKSSDKQDNNDFNLFVNDFTKEEKEEEQEIFLFNDKNGNPDPNGIMWIRPDVLAKLRNKDVCRNGQCRK